MLREGYKFSAAPVVLGAAAWFLGWYWAAAILLILGAFILFFFRDPERAVPAEPGAVVSPADGRVTAIVEEDFEGRPGRRISIFLAVWDVHINRAPLAGCIARMEYRRGKFLNAMRGRASEENEQNVIRLETPRGAIFFKQIAGWIARRVVCWKHEGDVVALGERVGLIRFGSRTDVWLPRDAEIVVRVGQHVAGGSSLLARWP